MITSGGAEHLAPTTVTRVAIPCTDPGCALPCAWVEGPALVIRARHHGKFYIRRWAAADLANATPRALAARPQVAVESNCLVIVSLHHGHRHVSRWALVELLALLCAGAEKGSLHG